MVRAPHRGACGKQKAGFKVHQIVSRMKTHQSKVHSQIGTKYTEQLSHRNLKTMFCTWCRDQIKVLYLEQRSKQSAVLGVEIKTKFCTWCRDHNKVLYLVQRSKQSSVLGAHNKGRRQEDNRDLLRVPNLAHSPCCTLNLYIHQPTHTYKHSHILLVHFTHFERRSTPNNVQINKCALISSLPLQLYLVRRWTPTKIQISMAIFNHSLSRCTHWERFGPAHNMCSVFCLYSEKQN